MADERSLKIWLGVTAAVVVGAGALVGGLFGSKKSEKPSCGNLPMSCAATIDKFLGDAELAPKVARELDALCKDQNFEACAALGPFLLDGAGVTVDEARAKQAQELACGGGFAGGCNNLGVMYAVGRGVEQDDSKAAELYLRACESGDVARGCYNYAGMLQNGLGVTRDEKLAAAFLGRACDAGESNGCLNLGVLYYEGRGVARDEKRARELFDRACKNGNSRACTNLQ